MLFHPEADLALVEAWLGAAEMIDEAVEVLGNDGAARALPAQAEAAEPVLVERTAPASAPSPSWSPPLRRRRVAAFPTLYDAPHAPPPSQSKTCASPSASSRPCAASSFEVETGEVFGFLGPNGAGKTTTINMLCTLAKPTAGSATVAGHDVVAERDDVRRHIGLVFQDPTLDGYLTAEQNLRLHAELYGVEKAWWRRGCSRCWRWSASGSGATARC